MTWQPEIDELRKREELGRRMGGADKIKRHRDLGKLTVRERVAGILDEGSFHEIGCDWGRSIVTLRSALALSASAMTSHSIRSRSSSTRRGGGMSS